MSETGSTGFDAVSVPDGEGLMRFYTREEFEDLPLGDRVRMLMNHKTQFYLNGAPVAARDALHEP
jgi:hypothetical protein